MDIWAAPMVLLASVSLFPPYSLDTSILAAVLVGVFLLAFFTETLGWVFVGLVVPGYLASVFVIHPEAGATVVAEAILTYAVSVGLSRGLSRTGAWSDFFGRDRFFVIVLASVLVRAVSEVWLLPALGGWLDHSFGTTFTVERTLHSIGLVLVPLTANAFWKLELRRGLFQVGVPVFLTWALLQFVLLPTTNLSFSSLELTYEDVAQNFLASPKTYILLLTTAFLAARFNLRYGWDFNGILVPALLAVTFVAPAKVLATFAEVLVLVLGTKALLRVPGLKTLNLEGPRKTVLVFTLGFVVKWGIGWALGGRVPGLKVTDLFGFGYLVPTLLAVKILQKQVISRIVFATVHTSLAGFAVGSAIGFLFSLVEPTQVAVAQKPPVARTAPTLGLQRTPLGVMAYARATTRESEQGEIPVPRKRGELRRYEVLWEALDRFVDTSAESDRRLAEEYARALGLELTAVSGAPRPAFALVEPASLKEKIGWDTALLFPGAHGPVLEVPRPATEAPAAEAAAILCERVACRAIVVSGVDTVRSGDRHGDALLEEHTPLQRADAVLARHPRVLVRGDARVGAHQPLIHLKRAAEFPAIWPGATLANAEPPEADPLWGSDAFAVLRANPADLAAIVTSSAPAPLPAIEAEALLAALSTPDRPGVAAAPDDAELLVLEREVAGTVLALDTVPPDARTAKIDWARAMAAALGLELRPVTGLGNDEAFLLSDPETQRGRTGIAAILRDGGAPIGFEVPNPNVERGTLPLALELFRLGDGRALVVTDTAPPVRGAGAAHPAIAGQFGTSFQALHQAIHDALPAKDGLVLQVRGYSDRPNLGSEVLIDLSGPLLQPAQRPEALTALLSEKGPLGWLGPVARYHDGAAELVGLSDASPQQSFSRTFGGARLASLWFSERIRGAYLPPRDVAEHLALTGLEPAPAEAPLLDALAAGVSAPAPEGGALRRRFDALDAIAERYVAQQNVQDLELLAKRTQLTPGAQLRVEPSGPYGLPVLVLELHDARRSIRGAYFVQQERALGKRLELRGVDEPERLALERALRARRSVVVDGQRVTEARR